MNMINVITRIYRKVKPIQQSSDILEHIASCQWNEWIEEG